MRLGLVAYSQLGTRRGWGLEADLVVFNFLMPSFDLCTTLGKNLGNFGVVLKALT